MILSHVAFERPDPYGDGLGDDIAMEQASEVIDLNQQMDGRELEAYLEAMINPDDEIDKLTFADD